MNTAPLRLQAPLRPGLLLQHKRVKVVTRFNTPMAPSNGHMMKDVMGGAQVLPINLPSDMAGSSDAGDTPKAPYGPDYAPAPAMKVAALLSPEDTYMAIAEIGRERGRMSIPKTFIMAIFAGCYIAIGGFLSSAVVSTCPMLSANNPGLAKLLFALLFPVGLFMHTLHATELFTGNTMKMTAGVIEGKIGLRHLAKNWITVYLGNLVGSLMILGLCLATGIFEGAAADFPVSNAIKKTSHTWGQTFARAILCNWLVCVAVWCTTMAKSLEGKVLGLWPPIMAFVATGFEHSVANMFLIPLGMALGAPISVFHFVFNCLAPVTLGNIVGGMMFMGMSSATFYGSLGQGMPWLRERVAAKRQQASVQARINGVHAA